MMRGRWCFLHVRTPHRRCAVTTGDGMEGTRFDYLARTVATSGSRRRVLGALLAGALGGLRLRATRADERGTAIADASGGNDNLAGVVDRGNDTRCQPTSPHDACEDRCNRVVNDGCGGE